MAFLRSIYTVYFYLFDEKAQFESLKNMHSKNLNLDL